MDNNQPAQITNQMIAIICIVGAVGMCFGAFFLSRADHDLKLMSLQSVLTLGGTLTGIAGTLLVGATAYRQLSASDLPPGTSLKSAEHQEISIPPEQPASPK